MPTYARIDLLFERGEGAYLFTEDGDRYLDFASGIAVTALGHAHPHLVEVLNEQGAKLWHLSNLYRVPGQEKLAERLVANSFADTIFFGNSGAEANECGFKMIRRYFYSKGQPEKNRIITVQGAFHGRTLATLSAGGQEKYLAGFSPRMDGFDQVAFGNLNELRAAITSETAGILVEPVQGEGGMKAAPVEYMQALRQICDEFDLLLMVDEIQCGMGRTGKLFAYEWAGIEPDVMSLAKGLGGGFPVGACLATERAASGMTVGTHGSTFGGNPLAMAIANGVLDVMLADGFLDHVNEAATDLRARLNKLVERFPKVLEEVRGKGLMIGLKCVVPNTEFQAKLRDQHLLSVAAGENVVRLLPPLIIGDKEITESVAAIEHVAQTWFA
jgi:acetylornithine/N-succinyldiaminopimelate aminotransferase